MPVYPDEYGYLLWRKQMQGLVQAAKDNARPELVSNLKSYMSDFPWLRPAVAIGMAKANVQDKQAYQVAVADLYWQAQNTNRFGTQEHTNPKDRLEAWDKELKSYIRQTHAQNEKNAKIGNAFGAKSTVANETLASQRFGDARLQELRQMRSTVRAALQTNDPLTMNAVLTSINARSAIQQDPYDANAKFNPINAGIGLTGDVVNAASKVVKPAVDWYTENAPQTAAVGQPALPPVVIGANVNTDTARQAQAGAGQAIQGAVRNTTLAASAGIQGLTGVARGGVGFAEDAWEASQFERLFSPDGVKSTQPAVYQNPGLDPLSAQAEVQYRRAPRPQLSPYGVLEQTQLGQAFISLIKGEPADVGTGWFPDPESATGKAQAEASRKYSPQLFDGHAWTWGRQSVDILGMDPDTPAATIVSGLVDGVWNLAADPANLGLVALADANKARKVFDLTEAGDAYRRVSALEGRLAELAQDVADDAILPNITRVEDANGVVRLASADGATTFLTRGEVLGAAQRRAADARQALDDLANSGDEFSQWGDRLLNNWEDLNREATDAQAALERARAGDFSGVVDDNVEVISDRLGERAMAGDGPIDEVARRAELLREAGVSVGRRPIVMGKNPVNWLYGRSSRRLIEELTRNRDPYTIYWALDGQVPIQSATGQRVLERLANAETEGEVRLVLSGELGTSIDRVPKWRGGLNVGPTGVFGRYGMDMPERTLTMGEPDRNAKTLFETFAISNVPEATQRRIFNEMVYAHGRGDDYAWVTAAFDAMREQLRAVGIPEDRIDDLIRVSRRDWERSAVYGANAETGDDMPLQLRFGTTDITAAGEPDAMDIPDFVRELDGPRWETERLSSRIELPDPRELRRLVTKYGLNKAYDSVAWKGIMGLGDTANSAWKAFVLLRAAWPVRVIGDEMLRMAATGDSPFLHPLSHLAWVIGDPRDGTWIEWMSGLGRRPADEIVEAVTRDRAARLTQLLDEGVDRAEALRMVDDEMPVPMNFGRRWAGNVRRFKARGLSITLDDAPLGGVGTTFRIGGRGNIDAGGATFDLNDYFGEALTSRLIRSAETTPRRRYLRHFEVVDRQSEYWARGVAEELYRLHSSTATRMAMRYDTEREFLDALWEEPWGLRLRQQMAAGRRGDNAEDWQRILDNRVWSNAYGRAILDHMDNFLGRQYGGNAIMEEAIRTGYLTTETGDRIALSYGGHPNPELVDYVRGWREQEGVVTPEFVKVRKAEVLRLSAKNADKEARDDIVNYFFDALMTRPSNYLTRSPTFRKKYWEEVERLLPSMDQEAQAAVRTNLARANLPEKQTARITRALDQSGYGSLRFGQADTILKQRSLDYTRGLLYDLHKRNQFFDAARLVFPFGEAWKEVLQTWGRIITENPNVVRRLQQGIQGAMEAEIDPISGLPTSESKGGGIFRVDPVSKQLVFTYPFSGWLSQVGFKIPGTGIHIGADMPIPIPMHGQVRSLNMFMTGLPGVGFGTSVLASELIPNKPGFDFLKEMIFPFGEPQGDTAWDKFTNSFKPTWFRNFERAQKGPATDRIFGNTVFDVMAVLASTGKYDISSSDKSKYELIRLYEDATDKAQWLTMIRGIGAFSLPASPGFDFYVKKHHGDPGGEELLMLQHLRDDYIDYREKLYKKGVPDASDQAFKWFIRKYGADNVFATQSKSIPNVAGLEYSQEQHDWERNNRDVVRLLPKTWALFAPQDGEFKIEVYGKFLDNEYASKYPAPINMGEAALSRLGQAVYDWHVKTDIPEWSSARDKSVATRQIADWVQNNFSGWTRSYAGNEKWAEQLQELKVAAGDPNLQRTDLGKALGLYFEARDFANNQAVQQSKKSSSAFTSKETQSIRDRLFEYVDQLTARYPAFGLAWDKVLSREWEQDNE